MAKLLLRFPLPFHSMVSVIDRDRFCFQSDKWMCCNNIIISCMGGLVVLAGFCWREMASPVPALSKQGGEEQPRQGRQRSTRPLLPNRTTVATFYFYMHACNSSLPTILFFSPHPPWDMNAKEDHSCHPIPAFYIIIWWALSVWFLAMNTSNVLGHSCHFSNEWY